MKQVVRTTAVIKKHNVSDCLKTLKVSKTFGFLD